MFKFDVFLMCCYNKQSEIKDLNTKHRLLRVYYTMPILLQEKECLLFILFVYVNTKFQTQIGILITSFFFLTEYLG